MRWGMGDNVLQVIQGLGWQLHLFFHQNKSLLMLIMDIVIRNFGLCIWLCDINTPEAGSWAGFERPLGFQCFWAHRQISLHGGFTLRSKVLTTWLHAKNADPRPPHAAGHQYNLYGSVPKPAHMHIQAAEVGCKLGAGLKANLWLEGCFECDTNPQMVRGKSAWGG